MSLNFYKSCVRRLHIELVKGVIKHNFKRILQFASFICKTIKQKKNHHIIFILLKLCTKLRFKPKETIFKRKWQFIKNRLMRQKRFVFVDVERSFYAVVRIVVLINLSHVQIYLFSPQSKKGKSLRMINSLPSSFFLKINPKFFIKHKVMG